MLSKLLIVAGAIALAVPAMAHGQEPVRQRPLPPTVRIPVPSPSPNRRTPSQAQTPAQRQIELRTRTTELPASQLPPPLAQTGALSTSWLVFFQLNSGEVAGFVNPHGFEISLEIWCFGDNAEPSRHVRLSASAYGHYPIVASSTASDPSGVPSTWCRLDADQPFFTYISTQGWLPEQNPAQAREAVRLR